MPEKADALGLRRCQQLIADGGYHLASDGFARYTAASQNNAAVTRLLLRGLPLLIAWVPGVKWRASDGFGATVELAGIAGGYFSGHVASICSVTVR